MPYRSARRDSACQLVRGATPLPLSAEKSGAPYSSILSAVNTASRRRRRRRPSRITGSNFLAVKLRTDRGHTLRKTSWHRTTNPRKTMHSAGSHCCPRQPQIPRAAPPLCYRLLSHPPAPRCGETRIWEADPFVRPKNSAQPSSRRIPLRRLSPCKYDHHATAVAARILVSETAC